MLSSNRPPSETPADVPGGRALVQSLTHRAIAALPAAQVLPPQGPVAAEVLEFQSPSEVLIAAPVSRGAHKVVWIMASMFVLSALALGAIPVDRVVTARAKVISVAPTLVVQPLETSIVRSVDVREGQRVRKGDLLARLDPTFTAADAGAIAAQVANMDAEVARLTAEAADAPFVPAGTGAAWDTQAALFAQRAAERAARLEAYAHKITGQQVAVTRSEQEAATARQRLSVAREIEGMRAELERNGSGSKLNSLLATDSRHEMESALARAVNTAEAARRDLDALQAERDGYDKNWRAEALEALSRRSGELNAARETLNKAGRRQELTEMRAESDATVLTVADVSAGSVLQSGDQLITLAPADTPLEVEANITGRGGLVQEGDPVAVKFDMLPFTDYGMAHGRVKTISADSFTAHDEARSRAGWAGALPAGDGEPYFRSRIAIEDLALRNLPAQFRLQPGMPATAEIKIGRRTVLSYLLGRVMRVGAEGMREP